ncbi:hypothetical protein D3C85_1488620 [compost metagenome]
MRPAVVAPGIRSEAESIGRRPSLRRLAWSSTKDDRDVPRSPFPLAVRLRYKGRWRRPTGVERPAQNPHHLRAVHWPTNRMDFRL